MYQTTALDCIYMGALKLSKVGNASLASQLLLSPGLKLLFPSFSLKTTGPQSSEWAPKARGGPVCLAQHGWRGRRWWRRGQNRHTTAPPRGTRPLLLHTEAGRRTHQRLSLLHVLVAIITEWWSSIRSRNATSRVQHYQLRGCTF